MLKIKANDGERVSYPLISLSCRIGEAVFSEFEGNSSNATTKCLSTFSRLTPALEKNDIYRITEYSEVLGILSRCAHRNSALSRETWFHRILERDYLKCRFMRLGHLFRERLRWKSKNFRRFFSQGGPFTTEINMGVDGGTNNGHRFRWNFAYRHVAPNLHVRLHSCSFWPRFVISSIKLTVKFQIGQPTRNVLEIYSFLKAVRRRVSSNITSEIDSLR